MKELLEARLNTEKGESLSPGDELFLKTNAKQIQAITKAMEIIGLPRAEVSLVLGIPEEYIEMNRREDN